MVFKSAYKIAMQYPQNKSQSGKIDVKILKFSTTKFVQSLKQYHNNFFIKANFKIK